jgi:hypothetical protein
LWSGCDHPGKFFGAGLSFPAAALLKITAVQFREFIPAAIPGMIMDLLKGNHESDVRKAAANAVGKFSEQSKIQWCSK